MIIVTDLKKFLIRLAKTWHGRIILLNTAVFILISLQSGTLILPSSESLTLFGAKEPVAIAEGEWWRFVSAMFLHAGLIHFLLNNVAIYYVGRIIETLIGSLSFLSVYIFSGVVGNVASTFLHFSVGAGASGAIFGLIGVGCVVEVLVPDLFKFKRFSQGKLAKLFVRGPFSFLVLVNILLAVGINLVFGFLKIPVEIDNTAHIGGLVAGLICGLFTLGGGSGRIRIGAGLLLAFLGVLLVLSLHTFSSTDYITRRYIEISESHPDKRAALAAALQALRLDPENYKAVFRKGLLLVELGWLQQGVYHLWEAASLKGSSVEDFEDFLSLYGERLDPSSRAAVELMIKQMYAKPLR